MTPPEPHRLFVRVYHEDTDAGGVVYHAGYLRFAERARTEMLRARGVDQQRLRREHGLAFVVRRLTADYLAPALLDDLLCVETRVTRAAGAALDLEQVVRRDALDLVRLVVRVACVGEGGRPARLPAGFRPAPRQGTRSPAPL